MVDDLTKKFAYAFDRVILKARKSLSPYAVYRRTAVEPRDSAAHRAGKRSMRLGMFMLMVHTHGLTFEEMMEVWREHPDFEARWRYEK